MDFFVLTTWPFLHLIFAVSIYLYFKQKQNYLSKLGIKGPKPVLVFGTPSHERYGQKQSFIKKYGKIYGVNHGSTPVLTVADPEIAKDIMVKNFDIFMNKGEKRLSSVRNRNLSLIVANEWKPLRTIMSQIFVARNLRLMYPNMIHSVHQFTDALQGFASSGTELEIRQIIQRFAIDITANSIVNMNNNSHINDSDRHFAEIFDEIFMQTNKFYELAKMHISMKYMSPLMHIGIESVDKMNCILNVCKELINERRDCVYNEDKEFDYVKHMIKIRNNLVSKEHRGQSEQVQMSELNLNITDDDIAINFWVLLMGSNIMITHSMAAIVYELTINEDKQQLLYEVLNEFYETHDDMDIQSLIAVPYLNAVVFEALRLYGTSYAVERVAAREYPLSDTGIVLRKGQVIQIALYAMLHCEDNFPNACAFVPERHLTGDNNGFIADYQPFGVGPRNCPAMHFALVALKLCTAQLIMRYRLYRTFGTDVPMMRTEHVARSVPLRVIVGVVDRDGHK